MSKQTAAERQLVVFSIADETYGVDISTVREIIRMQELAKVPGAPTYVEGVINLRGRVIPVVSLRSRFALSGANDSTESRIVVVEYRDQHVGLHVDSVNEVLRITTDSIQPPSSIVTSADLNCLSGIANLGDRMIILLDADQLLEQSSVTEALAAADESEATEHSEEESYDEARAEMEGVERELEPVAL